MNRKSLILLLTAAALMLAAGCRRLEPVGQTGSLTLHFSSAELATKGAEDGDLFNNLFVVVATGNATSGYTVVDKKKVTGVNVVEFQSLSMTPTYEVFSFGNIDLSSWDNNEDVAANALANANNVLSSDGKLLIPGEATARTIAASGAMLLTAHQQFKISPTEASAEVKLLRPVVRIKMEVRNHTQMDVSVTGLHFSAFKPEKTFLWEQWNATGVPTVPSDPNYTAISFSDLNIPATTIVKSLPTIDLYENAASEYRLFGTVALAGSGSKTIQDEKGNEGTPLRKIDNDTHQVTPITFMRRNQQIEIVLNIYYNAMQGQLEFVVTPWTSADDSYHTFK